MAFFKRFPKRCALANAIATVRINHEIRSPATDVSVVEGISRVDNIQCIITEVCMDIFTWKLYFNEWLIAVPREITRVMRGVPCMCEVIVELYRTWRRLNQYCNYSDLLVMNQ